MRDPTIDKRHGSVNEQRARDTGYTLSKLWQYVRRFRLLIAVCALLTLASNALLLAAPKISGRAVNAMEGGVGHVDFTTVFTCAKWMLACYLLSAVLSFVLSRLMIHLSQETVRSIRQDLFEKLVDLPIAYFDTHTTGDIVSRISYDIDTIGASLSTDLLQIVNSIITVVGCFTMMLSISWQMSLLFCVTIPVTIRFAAFRNKRMRPLFRKRSAALGRLNGYSEEMISGMKTVKAYHREQVFIDRFEERNQEAVDSYYEADYYGSVLGPSTNFISNVTLSLLGVLGALLYLWRMLALGDLSSFILYSRKFSGPINETANIFSELQSALAAAERVFLVIDEEPEPADGEDAVQLEQVRGDVDIRAVQFGYNPDRIVLRGLDLQAPPGSLTAIVGPTGAGKTTIINLLMRFYDPQQGKIFVDGTEIRNATRASLRLSYSMVLQDTWLFTGTVYDNIAYGRPDATREQVEQAAKTARIHDFITHLPQGYDTVLSEDGTNISKGQKQLLTIARAMLLDSAMLILDEATSNVDTRTEMHIQAAMRTLMQGRTCFVIAHRLSTIQHADNILVIDGGTVKEQGTHQELLQKNGLYAKLYKAQFT